MELKYLFHKACGEASLFPDSNKRAVCPDTGSARLQYMEKMGMHKPIVKTKKFKAIPCIKPHLNIDKDTLDSIFKEGKWEEQDTNSLDSIQ